MGRVLEFRRKRSYSCRFCTPKSASLIEPCSCTQPCEEVWSRFGKEEGVPAWVWEALSTMPEPERMAFIEKCRRAAEVKRRNKIYLD